MCHIITPTPKPAGLDDELSGEHCLFARRQRAHDTVAVERARHGRYVAVVTPHRHRDVAGAGPAVVGWSTSQGAIGETVVGESHAWAEVWLGDWWPVDPTNPVPVGSSHVLVARAREYRDVTPLKGIYSGSPSSTPTVLVELTRRA